MKKLIIIITLEAYDICYSKYVLENTGLTQASNFLVILHKRDSSTSLCISLFELLSWCPMVELREIR